MVKFYQELIEKRSKRIKSGNEYTLYMTYCEKCNYKMILAGAPCGPGGTLNCPLCKDRKENGPHLEGTYGHIGVKTFKIILPKDVD